MAFTWISSALAMAMMASSAMGFAIGAIPVQTVGGIGDAFSPAPTKAPSMELVKAKMVKKAVTNVCTEWTIPGGFGQPQCGNSETCLFKTATNGYFYEGCGQTSIAYDWVTECFNYPQSGTPPVSEIYCPKSAPYCGYFAFVFDVGATFYNFGCSTSSYGLLVELVATTANSSTSTIRSGSTTSNSALYSFTDSSAASASSTKSNSVSIALSTITSTVIGSAASSSSTTKAQIGSHKAKVAVGLVAGVVVGGLVVIAALIGLLVWCCVRKRKQKKSVQTAQAQQQQADAASATAFQNNQRISEIGGTNVKPFVGAYAPVGQEKPGAVVGATEVYGNTQPMQQNNGVNPQGVLPTPPPVYAQPGPSPMRSPHQNYNELATPLTGPDRPVSPMGSTPSQTPAPQIYGQSQPGELVGDNRQSSPGPQQTYQPYPPPPQQYQATPTELVGENRHSSPPPQQQMYAHYPQSSPQPQPSKLGGENRGSWQTPPGVQEIGAGAETRMPHLPPGPPPGVQEIGMGAETRMPRLPQGPPPGVQETGAGAVTEARQPRPPQGPPPGFTSSGPVPVSHEPIAEMSATVGGSVPRRPVGAPAGQAVDMSGAPMSENWNGHHELE